MGFGISDLYSILPAGTRYRELWLPELINSNASLPSSIAGGHGLTLTGARKGTTADGVHGISGVATSNINLGAIHDNEDILYIKIRFKLDQPFSDAATTDQYLFGKYDGPNDYLMGWLEADDGMFHMAHAEGGAVEAIVSAEDSWDTGWHTIFVSLHNVNGQRLIVDGGAVVTQVGNTTAITLTADFVLMCRDDGVSTEGLLGVEVDVVLGIVALTTDQEGDLSKGIPPAAATEEYLLDEGRGVTAYNRGSSGAGSDGTLDTSCTWAFGQVQQPVISFDRINDKAVSSAGVNIKEPLTLVWVAKIKSTYSALSDVHRFVILYVNAQNQLLLNYQAPTDVLRLQCVGNGTAIFINYASPFSIGDYAILIGTLTEAGAIELFLNGSQVGTLVGDLTGPVSAAAATVYVGVSSDGATSYDISKPLLIALIDGAFTQKQALAYSKLLNELLGLGLTI